MRALNDFEQKNVSILSDSYIDFALIEPTKTGLDKSIMDATFQVRSFFKDANLHDYETQKQGQQYRVLIPSLLLEHNREIISTASLYRPVTKKGDPRIWFSSLKKCSAPNDIMAIFYHENILKLINISRANLENNFGIICETIKDAAFTGGAVAAELLEKITEIAQRGYVQSVLGEKKRYCYRSNLGDPIGDSH